MPSDALIALQGLDDVLGLKQGESLMIFGASGGIGRSPGGLASGPGRGSQFLARPVAPGTGEGLAGPRWFARLPVYSRCANLGIKITNNRAALF
jgi:hypothetical protein